MSLHTKTRRRLLILASVTVALILAATGLYIVRMKQHAARLAQSRADGIAAFHEGDYFSALHKVGSYLGRNQHDAEALFYYAQARQQVEEPNARHIREAIRLYLRLLDLQPNHPEARHKLLALYTRYSFNTEALATADLLLKANPNDIEALSAKAAVLGRMRRYDEAVEVSRRHNEAAPEDLASQILTLQLMVARGDDQELVTSRTETRLAAAPENPRLQLLHSIAYAMVNDLQSSREWARRSARHEAPDAAFLSHLVHHLNRLGMFSEARATIDRVGTVRTDDPEVEATVVGSLWERDMHDQIVRRLSDLDPHQVHTDATLLAYKAMALSRLNRDGEAEEILDALAERRADEPATAWAGVIRAVFNEEADSQQQVAACEEAVRKLPGNAHIRFFLGAAYSNAGEHDLAIEQWSQAFRASPAWPAPLTRSAETLALAGRGGEALELARAAQERAPDEVPVMITLAQAWAAAIAGGDEREQSMPELLTLVREIQSRVPGEPRTLPLMVALLARTGETDEAKQAARDALEADPAYGEQTLLHLAAVSRERGLGLEEECYERSRVAHGMTFSLAYDWARHLGARGQGERGLALLEEARLRHDTDDRDWRIVWVRYLDQSEDPRARDEWTALAKEMPDDVDVQWLALGARAMRDDRAFQGEVLERLRGPVGEQGVRWRLTKAQWLLDGQPNEAELLEAAGLLTQVTRAAPSLVPPRMLLASCLQRLGNISGAIEQLTAALEAERDSVNIELELARLVQSQADFERARQHLDRVVANPELNDSQRRVAAQLLAQQGESGRAVALMQQGQAATDDETPDLVMAMLYRQQNDPARAEEIYRRLLEEPELGTVSSAADFYASQGRMDEAEQVLARLDELTLEPGVRELVRGDFELRYGRHDRAVGMYREAVRQAPQNAVARRQLVLSHLLAGQAEEAIAAAEEGLRAIPENVTLETFRQQASLVRQFVGDEEVRALVIELLRGPSASAPATEALYILADERRGTSPDVVLTRLRQLADRHPRALTVQIYLIQRYIRANRLDDGVTVATRTMQIFPTAPEPAEIAAQALAAANRWDEVIPVAGQWRRRAVNNPRSADILLTMAHLKQRNPQRALEQIQPHLSAALENPDREATVILLYAQAEIGLRRPEGAAEVIAPLISTSAEWRAAWMQLAMQIMDDSVAAQWLEQVSSAIAPSALEERITLAQAWQTLARRTKRPQHLETARTALDSVAEDARHAPGVVPQWMLMIGLLYEQDANMDAAEAAYRRAIELDANQPIALNNLAYTMLNRGDDLSEALRHARRAVQLNPNIPNFHDTLAWVHAKLGDDDAAIAEMNKAIELEPANVVWKINLGMLLTDFGRLDEAREVLNQIEATQTDESQLSGKVRERLRSMRAAI